MEPLRDSRSISRGRIVSGGTETTCAPHTRHGTKLRDVLMSDKPTLSYADFHHELTKNPALPKYVSSQQRRELERKNLKEEELVRYMSNLPSYLEKGKNYQEKALNVGVLDWRYLEKWRNSQKPIPPKHSGYSPSSTSTSLFSSDGSSTRSSKGQNFSPASQKLQHFSLQSQMEASPKEGHVQDAKNSSSGRGHSFSPARHITQRSMSQCHPHKVYSGGGIPHEIEIFGGNAHKFQDSSHSTVSRGNHISRQHMVFGERKETDMKLALETRRKLIPDTSDVAATLKGKKIQHAGSTEETRRLRETNLKVCDREKSGVVVMPRDQLEHSRCGFTGLASFTANDRLSVEPGEKFLLARNNLEGRRLFSNDVCTQLGTTVSSQASHISRQSTSKTFQSPSRNNRQGDRAPTEAPHVPSFPTRRFTSPSRNRHTQENPVTEMRRESALNTSEPSPKARNPSPIRRLSMAMGKMIKNSGSRESSPLRRSSAKDCITKSGSEATDSSMFVDKNDNPCSDKLSTTTNNRGRSSPLRRLLDPLLKPRVSNCSDPSSKHSSSNDGSIKSRNKPLDSHPGKSVEVNLRSGNATTSASDAHHNSNNVSSTVQALLQVSFKNGLPLFTFAIDNESNILAATIRKSSAPGKGQNSWIYTFFAIREVKRKSGTWLNPGGKGSTHGYVPNVVAQMKVSDSVSSSSTKHERTDYLVSREFDLFAVDVGQGDEHSADFHPTNEIAAIIIKLPRITTRSNSKYDNSSFDWLDLSPGSLGTTVVLPGGLHTVPSKGEISKLAQRWRSGGLCDCGGWDLGCQLRVYTNKNENETKFDPSRICHIKDKLQLFSEGGQDNQPILSLAPFKERIYSVEFSSSFSLLQAFAVSVSFLDSKRPTELIEPSSSSVPEKVTPEVGLFELPIRSKMSNQVEAPGRYVSYPPHSPVGRV
ncbi:uncharacterized protein LOC141591550 [Silene latifolia]|uniref:uncharacterized protein LOC141591550 n=1 Tax=Silene latifolia TaxID=37657 RepID=UPI003D7709DA